MNKKIKTISKFAIPSFFVIILLFSSFYLGIISFQRPIQKGENGSATVIVDFGNGSNISCVENFENTTVYDLLLNASKIVHFSINSTYYSSFDDFMIDSITYNGAKYVSGDGGRYWGYYINGYYGSLGPSKQFVKNNDTIEWRFEAFSG